jgi:flagellar motility protein MotE (MotC chaperone)
MAVIFLLVGLAVGLAAGIVPRLYNIDPLQLIKPPAAEKEAAPVDKETASPSPLRLKEAELQRLLAEVTQQRAALEEREKPLAARETQLEVLRRGLEELRDQLDRAEKDLKHVASVELRDDELKNIKKLGKIWSKMEPTEIVPIAKGLNPELTTNVLASMSEPQAAAILGALGASPDTAKLASDVVVGLRRLKPAPPKAQNTEAR